MNLYDFDETIYDGDSTRDFCIYLYRHYPRVWRYIPRQLAAVVRYSRGKITKTAFKESLFSMFAAVPNIEDVVETFWDSHDNRVLAYYVKGARADDVIISASPEFIVAPMCKRLGIAHVICSMVDPKSGKFSGENCYGIEKVRRFIDAGFDPTQVEQVYSDSMSDTPMAGLGKEAFIVTKKGLTGWEPPKQKGMQALFTMFNKPQALIAVAAGVIHLVASGHAAKVIVKEKKSWPLGLVYGVISGIDMLSWIALFEVVGKKNPSYSGVGRALSILAAPTIGIGCLVASGIATLTGGPILGLAVATILGIPLFYKGVQIVFRNEIAQMQATQHLDEEDK